MKKTLSPEVERCRKAGTPDDGPFGMFRLTCPETGRELHVIASDGRDWVQVGLTGEPWEHVSVSPRYGLPRWVEMAWVKAQFWEEDELVVQFHPPKEVYVNIHERVLHLFRPTVTVIPLPPIKTV